VLLPHGVKLRRRARTVPVPRPPKLLLPPTSHHFRLRHVLPAEAQQDLPLTLPALDGDVVDSRAAEVVVAVVVAAGLSLTVSPATSLKLLDLRLPTMLGARTTLPAELMATMKDGILGTLEILPSRSPHLSPLLLRSSLLEVHGPACSSLHLPLLSLSQHPLPRSLSSPYPRRSPPLLPLPLSLKLSSKPPPRNPSLPPSQ
jgi:hypothetical protein